MRKVSLDEFKRTEINLLELFKKICNDNDLSFFLIFGSLLGCIRHNGFIPWDDDIDVAMPRKDYEKLIKIFKKNEFHNVSLISSSSNKQFHLEYGQLIDNRYYLISEGYHFPIGIWIDIFPFDFYPNSNFARRVYISFVRFLIHLNDLDYVKLRRTGRKWWVYPFVFVFKLFFNPLTFVFLRKLIFFEKHKFKNKKNAKYLSFSCLRPKTFDYRLYNYNDFEKTDYGVFEKNIYPIPVGYDRFLKETYGDYLQLPPKEERKSVHNFVCYRKDGFMNILVTGGAGYIGSHTAVELFKNGYNIVIADNFCNSSRKVLNRIETLTGKQVKCYDVDLVDYQATRQMFLENKFDAIIHFAGLKSNAESIDNPGLYYHVNFDSTHNLTLLMKEFGVKNIVFSGSATIYGATDKVPVKEDSQIGNVLSPYGLSKYMNELFLKSFCEENPGFKAISLRFFNPIGAHPSGIIGEDAGTSIPNNLLPYLLKVANGQLPYLKIFGNDYDTRDGTGLRDYIHVMDLADGHIAALNYFDKMENSFEAFNLGGGQGTTVLELINAFKKVNGVDIPYQVVGRRQGDMAKSYANVDKAYKLLGWKTKRSIEDCVRDSWNWQVKNPNGYGK